VSGADGAALARSADRRRMLAARGADAAALEALLAYTENVFARPPELAGATLPLPDEPFVAVWEQYRARADDDGAAAVLPEVMVQLRFPVREGISGEEAYRAATRRGEAPPQGDGIRWHAPERLHIRVEPTVAGRVPVVVAARADFEALVRALTARNEPVAVPPAMGAAMVAGYVNWDRVARHRAAWRRSHPDGDWPAELARIAPQGDLYRDRFILACEGPYSDVDAASLGLADEDWRALSLEIRIAHECAHYVTRRLLGSMRNNLLDELIADYAGITAATGRFRADWFLRFLGLEDHPAFRAGGRMEKYLGDPPLPPAALPVLQALVVDAARNVEAADRALGARAPGEAGPLLMAMTALTLEEIAAADGAARLRRAHDAAAGGAG